MTKIGVISNPKSQFNRQDGLASVKAVLADRPNVDHEVLRDFSALDEIVDRFIRDDVEVIAVNGGDGTVQAVLTALAHCGGAGGAPKLAVLQGGMTNVIAKDVGFSGKPAKALDQLIKGSSGDDRGEAPRAVEELIRPLIGLVTDEKKPPAYGMFFGAAGFYQAVLLAQKNVRPRGLAGNLASASSLVLILARLLLGQPGANNPLYRGESMTIGLDGRKKQENPYLLLIATTLNRLMLGLMPFWGKADRTIRYTSIAFPPKHLARALLPVLRGKPRSWMETEGYQSGTVKDMIIDIKSPVVLDGEIFHPEPGCPIRLTGDRQATFVRC